MASRPALAFALATVLAASGAGCATVAGPSGERAAATVSAYRAALEADDPRAAYALLSSRVQRDVPFPRFEAQWQAQKADRARQAAGIAAGAVAPVRSTSVVDVGDGQHASMVFQDGGWRLDAPLLAAESADTPQEALALFADGLDGRNVLALAPLMSRGYRERTLRSVAGLASAVRNPRDREITVTGSRAQVTVKVGPKLWRIELVREADGTWHVDQLR